MMKAEERQTYLRNVYELAREQGICHSQKEFAGLISASPSTISAAMRGDEKSLTNNLVKRVRIWATQYLESSQERENTTAGGDVFIPAATLDLYRNMAETIRIQAGIIAGLKQ